MTAFSQSDSLAARARSTSPVARQLPTDEAIEHIIQQATANAKAASGGRTPVIGRDTRTQLFVGNLPYRVRWQDLKDLFRKAGGTVLRADVSLGPDNRSRGYGTVLLSSAEDAGRAIDMFNGYVWQNRTLEVRPDRLPNEFDSSGMLVGGGPMAKLPSGLSPQPIPYGGSMVGVPPGLHPLTMSPSSAASMSLQPSSLGSSLSSSVGTSTVGTLSLAMSTGLGNSQDSIGFSGDVVRPSTFLGDLSRSPTAFKISSLNATANTPKSFDSLGLASGSLGGAGAAMSPLSGSHAAFPRSSPPSDRAGRTVYISNWPPQYGPAEFDHFFRTAGHIVKSDLGNISGIENRGYGTIVYSSEEEAKLAVARFNGYELNGWTIRLQIGLSEQQQHIPLPQLVEASSVGVNANAVRRSEDYQPRVPVPSMSNSATGNGEPSYPYATYLQVAPGMPSGYMMTSQPGSPYDSFPPSLAYLPVTGSPANGYLPPLNSGMYAYSAWHHAPSSSPPHNPGDATSSTASVGVAPNTVKSGSTSSNMLNGSTSPPATASSITRTAPGRITLPQPNMGAYPPAPVSPMHGRPPITPSMPSFTFISQPMPTPPLHPQFLSPGLGPYSPVNSSPGFYRPINPYFNLAPGAPVHYNRDPNAMSNTGSHGLNGSGVVGGLSPGNMMGGGQVTTPYFDMTAATAGSDAPQEYFPPMPIIASLAGAVHSMNLSSTSASNGAIGPSTGASNVENSRSTMGPSGTEEDPPYLEPVGVGRDGFPSLSAKHSDQSGPPADGVSRTGLTEWVTTPDDLPSSSNLQATSSTQETENTAPLTLPPPAPPVERPISADAISSSTDSKKADVPSGSNPGQAEGASPGRGGSGPIYSSSNKPKLTLGPIPKFHPPERMINAYLAQGINRTASGCGATGKFSGSGSMQKSSASDQFGARGSGIIGEVPVKAGTEDSTTGSAVVGVKANGTRRDALSVEASSGSIRRASWTEDGSRRQAIINGLHGGHALESEYVR